MSRKSKQLHKLYHEGEERLERDLSVEKIIKDLRMIKAIVKQKFQNENTKMLLNIHPNNVIDLELSEDDSKAHKTRYMNII